MERRTEPGGSACSDNYVRKLNILSVAASVNPADAFASSAFKEEGRENPPANGTRERAGAGSNEVWVR
jgi:hypothetical protein